MLGPAGPKAPARGLILHLGHYPLMFEVSWDRPADTAAIAVLLGPEPSNKSDFIALIADLHLKLESLVGHHTSAELLPGDVPTIDHKERQISVLRRVPLD